MHIRIILNVFEKYKCFSTALDKGSRKNIKEKKGDGETGEHKLNEMGALNMKQEK